MRNSNLEWFYSSLPQKDSRDNLFVYLQEVQVYDSLADTEMRVHDLQNEIDNLRARLKQQNT